MQLVSRISPATYVLDAVRKALNDGASADRLLPDLWPLLVTAVVFVPVGLWVFGQAEPPSGPASSRGLADLAVSY